ncbi:hypothetical protein MMC26_000072 [Xylographa opegraphella]|nr:hypothetical protein [Xylographa opegraphella]
MRKSLEVARKTSSDSWLVPSFLCPALARPSLLQVFPRPRARLLKPAPIVPKSLFRCLHVQVNESPPVIYPLVTSQLSLLPWTCPGCGAYTQIQNAEDAGFYTTSRKAVKTFVSARRRGLLGTSTGRVGENEAEVEDPDSENLIDLEKSYLKGDIGELQLPDGAPQDAVTASTPMVVFETPNTPVCDRCHRLLHHQAGTSIIHPTVQSIEDIIADSPYKYNHIYHILDAADFPLSLIPQLHHHLSLMPQRSQNRRAKTSKFYHGRKSEMSFIITRSDLLAPLKEQVDSMMPYLVQVLRDALGSSGKDVRLGNVRCVSSERGWWTKQLKEDIWERGGGGWMVGKVNVGKSSLFETVFPKGRNTDIDFKALRQEANETGAGAIHFPGSGSQEDRLLNTSSQQVLALRDDVEDLQNESLLPPVPEEVAYPVMPIVSALPGTTASPIRLPFGRGRGELIDLPGLDRGGLERFVSDKHKLDLVMRQRVKAEQHVVRPGQSILIGSLIRITPLSSDTILLACPFVPFESHVTNTEKAIAVHTQKVTSGLSNITSEGAGEKMASAGVFQLKWDVTKQRAGPLTASTAVGLKPQILPFAVLSADILIEGCGWVELAVQVRKKALQSSGDALGSTSGESLDFPRVEVFSPEGKHIGIRRPMNAWVTGGHHKAKARPGHARPRRSMKGVKKNLKKLARAVLAGGQVKKDTQ